MSANSLQYLGKDRRGSVAIMVAMMGAVLMVFTSLGVEVVLALKTQRQMQAAADSAAISSANAQSVGFPSPYSEEGFAIVAADGFSTGQATSFTTSCPSSPTVYIGTPCDGPHKGDANYVEAWIAQPFILKLAKVLFPGDLTLHGRAVAKIPSNSGGGSCTLSLAPGGSGLFMNGNANVNYTNCSISAASTGSSAVSLNGSNDSLSATTLYVGGNYSAGNGSLTMGSPPSPCSNSNPNCVTSAPPALNPYAGTTVPSCSDGTITKGIAQPGCYSGSQFSFSNKSLGLCPGVYVVTGNISLSGTASMTSLSSDPTASDYDKNFAKDCPGNTASGVTIFVTGSVSLTGQASLTLTPTTSGSYAGLLLYSATGNFTSCGGNCNTNLTGALVFPNGNIKYNGNGNDKGHSCTQIVGSTIEFVGNATLGADCANVVSNMKQILQPASLVE